MSDLEKIASILDGSYYDFVDPIERWSGELITIYVFIQLVNNGTFTDADGFGLPVRDNKAARGMKYIVFPSDIKNIPAGTTHILWFNK